MKSNTASNLEKFISQDLPYLKLLPTRVSPAASLEHIIDGLVHPTPARREWLAAIGRRRGNPDEAPVEVKALVALGAAAGISEQLAADVVTAVARADGLGWSHATASDVVENLYQEYHRQQRVDDTLPTLEPDPAPTHGND